MRIIFENLDKSIGILIPTQECIDLFGIEVIAKKDVPAPYEHPVEFATDIDEDGEEYEYGIKFETYKTPFWIVEDDFIPSDREFRGAWEIDKSMGEPHGYGSEYYTFEEVLTNDSN